LPAITLRPTFASSRTVTDSPGLRPVSPKLTRVRALATGLRGDRDDLPVARTITNHARVPDRWQSATVPCNVADSGVTAVGRPVTTPGRHRSERPAPAASDPDPPTSSTAAPSATTSAHHDRGPRNSLMRPSRRCWRLR
jgi:hypothetical protein